MSRAGLQPALEVDNHAYHGIEDRVLGACRPEWAILSSPSQFSPRRYPNHSALCANSQLLVWHSKHAALASRGTPKLASNVVRLQMPILALRGFRPVKSQATAD